MTLALMANDFRNFNIFRSGNNTFIATQSNRVFKAKKENALLIIDLSHELNGFHSHVVVDSSQKVPLFFVNKQKKMNIDDVTLLSSENNICYRNYIGRHFVLFFDSKWMFFSSGIINTITLETHPILFDHIGNKLHILSTDYCYHVLLCDHRLETRVKTYEKTSRIILLSATSKRACTVQKVLCSSIFESLKDHRLSNNLHISEHLAQMERHNKAKKKMMERGIIVNVYGQLVTIDTYTFLDLNNRFNIAETFHRSCLKLFLQNRLGETLQYIENYNTIAMTITRMKKAMTTINGELIDAYHMLYMKGVTAFPSPYQKVFTKLRGQERATKRSIQTKDVCMLLRRMGYDLVMQLIIERKNFAKIAERVPGVVRSCSSTHLQSILVSRNKDFTILF